ncbi:MAG: stage 0 sporulation family protein [Chloroflexi bacterium]|nr:stage 0 sporulation family protein [Chloroflexota bacterium]
MAEVVGVRFKRAGKIHYFNPTGFELKVGDLIVADGGRGPEIGRVVVAPPQVIASDVAEPMKPVLRKATDEDKKKAEANKEKEKEAFLIAKEIIGRLRLPMKLMNVDSPLEGDRFTFHFTSEGRVDFRELARELSNSLKAKVDLRQVGPRDEAKITGGYGHCGRVLCCANHLSEFAPVSIKMAKEQEISLNPTKISGSCGRLLCCLAYEIEQYRLLKARLPKKGQQVQTPMGPATVVYTSPLTETVIVELETKATVEYPASQVKPVAAAGGEPAPNGATGESTRQGQI